MIVNAEAHHDSILLIDDNAVLLDTLSSDLQAHAKLAGVEIRKWIPTDDEGPPLNVFRSRIDSSTRLVVTDYDLTGKGRTGLFGPSIVEWCQALAIPVGDFSRGQQSLLPTRPNLFELRVPTQADEAPRFIVAAYLGFKRLREQLQTHPDLAAHGNLARVLATLLGRPDAESAFTLYMPRLESANAAILDKIQAAHSEGASQMGISKDVLLVYVLGHVLLNTILRYAGPILSAQALCAYVATTMDQLGLIAPAFSSAVYHGPFSEAGQWYWRKDVDALIEQWSEKLQEPEFPSFGTFNCRAVETALGHELKRHSCDRCGGVNGGFYCPFTHRPVCERSDCSVVATSWIPQGAQLCRVERDFYEEWSPLLGL